MKEVFELLTRISDLNAASGREYACFDAAKEAFGDVFDECTKTVTGSFTGVIKANKDGARTLLIDVPFDEPSFTVTKIFDGGFLKVCTNGNSDVRTLAASDAVVFGKKPVKGVFTSTPPHLQAAGDADKPLTVDDFYIDTGLSDDECRQIVTVGDICTLSSDCTQLLNGSITGRLISNKACIAAAVSALSELGKARKVNILCRFTSGTEVGSKGAKTEIHPMPDYAIVIDRANAYTHDAPDRNKNVIIGGGAVISYTAASSVRFTKYVSEAAKNENIPMQSVSQGNGTASDITSVAIATHGAHTCLVEIPVKNRYTQSEIVNENDILAAKALICAAVRRLEDDENV